MTIVPAGYPLLYWNVNKSLKTWTYSVGMTIVLAECPLLYWNVNKSLKTWTDSVGMTIVPAGCSLLYWNIKQYKIVAAFPGMHVSPVKHSYEWLPRKCDYRTDRQCHIDRHMPDKVIPMCRYALQGHKNLNLLCWDEDSADWVTIYNTEPRICETPIVTSVSYHHFSKILYWVNLESIEVYNFTIMNWSTCTCISGTRGASSILVYRGWSTEFWAKY